MAVNKRFGFGDLATNAIPTLAGAYLGNKLGIGALGGAGIGFGLSGNSPAQRLALGLAPIGIAYDQSNKILDRIPSRFATPFSTVRDGSATIDPTIRQGQDQILGQLRGNQGAFIQARVRPFERQAAQTRARIEQGLSRRGISGSLLTNELAKFESQVNPTIADQRAIATQESLNAQNNLLNQRFNQELSALGLSQEQINLLTGQAQLKTELIGRGLDAVGQILQPGDVAAGGQVGQAGQGVPAGADPLTSAAGSLIQKGIGAIGNGISSAVGAGTFTNLAGELPFTGGLSNPWSNPFIGGPNKIAGSAGQVSAPSAVQGAPATQPTGIGSSVGNFIDPTKVGGPVSGALGAVGGFATGQFIGDKFPSEAGNTGAKVGGTIGGIFGPIAGGAGAIAGGMIGNIFGSLTGIGGKKRPDFDVMTSTGNQGFKKGQFIQTPLGNIGFSAQGTRDLGGKGNQLLAGIVKPVVEMDSRIASVLNPTELAAVRASLNGQKLGNAHKMRNPSLALMADRLKTVRNILPPERLAETGIDKAINEFNDMVKKANEKEYEQWVSLGVSNEAIGRAPTFEQWAKGGYFRDWGFAKPETLKYLIA